MTPLSSILKTRLPLSLVCAGLACISYTNPAFAECARDDIDYYLSKGFTTEQITAICTSARTNTPSSQNDMQTPSGSAAPEMMQNVNPEPDLKSTNNKNELFLIEAIKGRNVALTENTLQYTLKTCIEYGDEDQYGFAPKACPQVRFEIVLKGLEVLKTGKRYIFYGDNEIQIKSTVTREVIEGLDSLKPEARRQLMKKLESGNKTSIPIRDDIPMDTVVQLLEELSL